MESFLTLLEFSTIKPRSTVPRARFGFAANLQGQKKSHNNFFIQILFLTFGLIKTHTMSILKFSDGVSIDTSGPLRTLELSDGVYVVGQGMLIPVDSREKALEIISQKTQE